MDIQKIEKIHHALTGHHLQLVAVGCIKFIPKDTHAILVITSSKQLQHQIKKIAKNMDLVACINPVDLEIDNHIQLNRFLVIVADNTEALKFDFISGIPEKLISSKFEIEWIEAFIEEQLFFEKNIYGNKLAR